MLHDLGTVNSNKGPSIRRIANKCHWLSWGEKDRNKNTVGFGEKASHRSTQGSRWRLPGRCKQRPSSYSLSTPLSAESTNNIFKRMLHYCRICNRVSEGNGD